MTEVIKFVIFLAFACGGAWFTLKETRRHVNGVGAKVRRLEQATMLLALDKKDEALRILTS